MIRRTMSLKLSLPDLGFSLFVRSRMPVDIKQLEGTSSLRITQSQIFSPMLYVLNDSQVAMRYRLPLMLRIEHLEEIHSNEGVALRLNILHCCCIGGPLLAA